MTAADDSKLREQIERSERARRLRQDPLLQEAFAAVEGWIFERWSQSDAGDGDTREKAYLMHRLLTELRSHIDSVAESGKLARQQLLEVERETLRERVRNKVRRGQ